MGGFTPQQQGEYNKTSRLAFYHTDAGCLENLMTTYLSLVPAESHFLFFSYTCRNKQWRWCLGS